MADLNYYFGPWKRDAEQNAWTAPTGTVGLLDFGSLNDCALSPSAIDQRGIALFCTPRAISLPSEYDLLDSGDCREIQVTTAHRNLVEAVLGVRIDAGGTLAEACSALFSAGDPTGQERWKPLTPTREGLYEIRLGGHSQVWGRKFAGPADKTWNKLRDLLRYDLQKHDDECKAEAKALKDLAKERRKQKKDKEADACDARAAKVEFHAEKALDAMCRKYRCLPSELSTTIRRGKASTTISDDFSGTLGNWTAVSGEFGITSGKLRKTTDAESTHSIRYNTALSSDDHYSQSLVTFSTGFPYYGPATRFSGSANTFYSFTVESSSTTYYMKVVAGTLSFGTTYAFSPSTSVTTKLNTSGSTHTGTANGVEKTAWSDSSISGNLYCGLFCYRRYATNTIEQDDFYATDGLAEGGVASGKRIMGSGIL